MDPSRLRRDEDGFTLVEIMVVVLIIAVLITIAVPVFAGFRARAYDREAHITVRNLYTIQRSHLVDNGYYVSFGDPYIFGPISWEDKIRADYEPKFESVIETGSWEDPLAIEYSVGPGNALNVCMIAQSKTGRFFIMNLSGEGPPRYGYTDNPAGWFVECQSGPTLSFESWD